MIRKEKEAMMWGAIAGAVPILGKIIVLNPELMISQFKWASFLGNSVIVIVLAFMGALVVRLNKETNISKAFQLGIMAPAILVGAQSAAVVDEKTKTLTHVQQQLSQAQAHAQGRGTQFDNQTPSTPSEKESTIELKGSSMFDMLLPVAYAQDHIPNGELREVGAFTAFWYGVTGNLSDGWFVIAGSFKDKSIAEREAVRWRNKSWSAKVGESAALWGGYYPLIIGSYLPKERAIAIRDKAITAGFPSDTYVWRR